MEAAAEDGSSVGDGVADVEGGDGVEDEFERVGSVFAGFTGETVEAFRALEELQCSLEYAARPGLNSSALRKTKPTEK